MRDKVFAKYEGRCAYCGCELKKGWHVDHIDPAYHNWTDEQMKIHSKKTRGANEIENLNPSCPRCNRWKSTYTIEQFRNEILLQIERLKRDSSQFRMALDFGLITETKSEVKFYFEIYTHKPKRLTDGKNI